MDVALDANVILNDPQMQGNAFHSLLDYLKKTNSSLILSGVVLDEVIARYPERLRPAVHKARGAVVTLNSLLSAKRIKLPTVDEARQIQRLKQKLLKPSRHVKSLVVRNFADVKIEEVVRRGIERIPPANGAGEELRDVIHWLMLLAHARKSKREVAFITADEHFQKGATLHPLLAKDAQDTKVSLHFHTSIDDFIKTHAPAPLELTEADAFAYYGKSHVMDRFEIEARRFFLARWPGASKIEVVERDVHFTRGALYDVGPNSQYGELKFSGELRVRVTTEAVSVNYSYSSPADFPTITYGLQTNIVTPSPMNVAPGYIMGYNFGGEPFGVLTNIASPPQVPSLYSTFPESAKVSGLNLFSTSKPSAPTSLVEDVKEFHAMGVIILSLRVVSGRVVKTETEKFALERIERVGEP